MKKIGEGRYQEVFLEKELVLKIPRRDISKEEVTRMKKYYDEHQAEFTIKEQGEDKVSPFENVKSSISSTLQQEKFKEMEQAYIDRLKQKYPVVIHDEVLTQAFVEEE